jgi:hypothetical protein
VTLEFETMTTAPRGSHEGVNQGFEHHADQIAALITLLGFLARLWAAHGTFLNPDEALHFRLADQPSLSEAYRQSLTASHPPLLTIVLYYWRALGTSELWLRLPSVLAGTAFCWMFYKWLSRTVNAPTGLVGLIFAAFLPPIVLLASEVRQYALLLMFLASAVYFLEDAFDKNSCRRIAAFSICSYLAILSHYSAFLFVAALALYVLFRIISERPPAALATSWAIAQLGIVALAITLYKTHLSKLGAGYSRQVLQGWMSDHFLHHSYWDRGHGNVIVFLLGHSFGVFQYFFGQLAVGDVMGLLFLIAVASVLPGRKAPENERRLAIFLLLCFAIVAAASLAHVYPYGGTRHVAFLIIPALAGVSVTVGHMTWNNWRRAVGIAVLIVLACVIFGKPRQPWMARADQSHSHIVDAMQFVNANIRSQDLIFTDYQSGLILGNYLCAQKPIVLEHVPATFEQFTCAGHKIIAKDYTGWTFSTANFAEDWQRLVESYDLKAGETVWIFQAGWDANLADDLRRNFAAYRDLHPQAFGNNIKIFELIVGS